MAKKVTRTTKKAPATRSTSSRASKTVSAIESPIMDQRVVAAPAARRSRAQYRHSSLLLIAGVLIVAGLIFFFRGIFVAAMVNGEPISRAEYNTELQKQSGKQVLNTIVTKKLIMEEAAKKHVSVSDAEVNTQINDIKNNLAKQGRKLEDALAVQGLTMDALKDQLKYQKIIQKLLGNTVKVPDAEIADYINKNKDSLPTDQNPDQIKKTVHDQLMQQKLNDATQSWIQGLQKNAKIDYFVQQ